MSLPSADGSVSEFLKAKVLKKFTSFSKLSNLFFILVLKRRNDSKTFPVLPTRSIHTAGPLMGLRNVHLHNLICGFP